MKPLARDYYLNPDVLFLSRDLLGKFLCTKINGQLTVGKIVETEAYGGIDDQACHTFNGRCTKKTETMYRQGGVAYIYLCYGIHAIFNVVTNIESVPQGVMIRSIEPIEGLETMLQRRNKKKVDRTLTVGPGALTKALGIAPLHNGQSLQGPLIWIEDRHVTLEDEDIVAAPRIGVEYAQEHAKLLWRYRIKNNPWTFKK